MSNEKDLIKKLGLSKSNNPELLKVEEFISKSIEEMPAKKALYEQMAKLAQLKVKALRKHGFTDDQAFQLIQNHPFWSR